MLTIVVNKDVFGLVEGWVGEELNERLDMVWDTMGF